MSEYRYMIWNDVRKCFQFPSIMETTEKGAVTCLFNKIGDDARKYRFKVKAVEKEKAKIIRQELKDEIVIDKIHEYLPNISRAEIKALVIRNRESKEVT